MPTGYTAGVADGSIADFNEYALQCARNFGACILLRDEPLSSEIPEFEPSDYHEKALTESKAALSSFLAMNENERRKMHADEHSANVKTAATKRLEIQEQRNRYEAMLAKAKAFKSSSPDHENYAKFIVAQLEESIEWDCSTDYYDTLARLVPFDEWAAKKISDLKHAVEYHTNAHREEVERTESRNKWIRQLKEALGLTT